MKRRKIGIVESNEDKDTQRDRRREKNWKGIETEYGKDNNRGKKVKVKVKLSLSTPKGLTGE